MRAPRSWLPRSRGSRRLVDPWEPTVLELAGRETVKVYDKVQCRTVDVPAPPGTVSGLLVDLGVPVDRQGQKEANRVVAILKANGWERYQVRGVAGRFWAYR